MDIKDAWRWPDYDPEEDFLGETIRKFWEENPPAEGGIDVETDNPEIDPGVSYNNQPLDYYLYYGVRNLTENQKIERLENTYYTRLMEIAKETTKERAKDYIERVEKGQHIPDDVISKIHDETLSPKMEEQARRASEQNFIHALRLGTLDAYHTNYVESKVNGEVLPVIYQPIEKWKLKPAVEQVLSERRGYDGNFYSWFFAQNGPRKSQELDDKFFKTVRDGLERGDTEKEIVDKATEVCTADNLNRARIKNIVRTETRRAFNEGMVLENDRLRKEAEAKGLESYIKAYKFTAILDGREWEGCHARDGLLIAADDPLLKKNTPPLHYFCRSKLTPLSKRFLERYGGQAQIDADRPKLEAAPEFQWHHTPDKSIFDEGQIED